MPNASRNHHYSPKGYLKRWVGKDGRLAAFFLQNNVLRARRKTPSQVGYEVDLYSSRSFKRRDELEVSFMAPLDTVASEVIDIFTRTPAGRIAPLTKRQRDGWSRFLMSTLHRTPARVAERKGQFEQVFRAGSRSYILPPSNRTPKPQRVILMGCNGGTDVVSAMAAGVTVLGASEDVEELKRFADAQHADATLRHGVEIELS